MRVDDVCVFEVHAGERGLETLDDVLPGETMVVNEDLTVRGAVVELFNSRQLPKESTEREGKHTGSDDKVGPLPAKVLDGLPHDDLSLTS